MGITDDFDFAEDVRHLEYQAKDKYGPIFLDSITTLLSGQKYSFKDQEFAIFFN